MRYLKDRWTSQLARNPKVRILHSLSPEMSCGIGMFALSGADPRKLTEALQNKHSIYTALMPHEEYVGIRFPLASYRRLE